MAQQVDLSALQSCDTVSALLRAIGMHSKSNFKKRRLALAIFHALLIDANAATIEVNDNGDAGVGCTLREAITNAENNNNGGGNGCDSGSALPDNITFDMASLASPTITLSNSLVFSVNNSQITIDGPGDGALLIDGGGANKIMQVTLTGPLTLNNLTLQNGSATFGGALDITSNLVTLNNCTISNNHATQRGAGIDIKGVSALFINDSTISNNVVESTGILTGRGGGVYAAGSSPVRISNSLITGNSARNSGGIYSKSTTYGMIPDLNIANSVIENNVSEVYGGGIEKRFADVFIDSSTIRNNTSVLRGGGLFTKNADVTILNSTVAGNTASTGQGGGAYITYGAVVEISGSTFSNNIAISGGGGGLALRGSQSIISNSTISNNQANSGSGGGVTVSTSGYLNLINSSVVANTANLGGGLVLANAGANLDISNSIVAGNTANLGAEIGLLSAQPITSSGVNLIGDNSNDAASAFFGGFVPGVADITATSDGSLPTPLNSIVDLSLRNNGGDTLTHNLVGNSPAIDAADANICGPGNAIATDQRSEDREQLCDIGAIEFFNDESCFVVPTKISSLAVFCL